MKLGEIIKAYRIEHNDTTRTFSVRAGLSHGYVSMLESGINPATGGTLVPSLRTINCCARAMNMSFEHLASLLDDDQRVSIGVDNLITTSYTSRDSNSSAVSIPVLGRVSAGIPLNAVEEVLDYEEIPRSMAATGEFFALQIHGQSMEPKFSDGDVVIVRRQEDVDSGDIAVVLVNGNDATIKKVKKFSGGINLVPSNPAYDVLTYTDAQIEALPVRIIGKVVELRSKF